MRDDETDGREHTRATLPPPPGEADIYDAKTQVGGLSAEALAMLRQLKDERPPSNRASEEVVPVFVDDEDPRSGSRPTPVEAEAEVPPVFSVPKAPLPAPSVDAAALEAPSVDSSEPASYSPAFGSPPPEPVLVTSRVSRLSVGPGGVGVWRWFVAAGVFLAVAVLVAEWAALTSHP
jgi:hypothetical protein